MENKEPKVQVLRWKCCNKIYAVAVEPHCYTNKQWLKEVKQAVKDGDLIEMLSLEESRNMEICNCNK